jgi:glucan phosphoethanolaminetransferase (alkaline phosphatase superfamily)
MFKLGSDHAKEYFEMTLLRLFVLVLAFLKVLYFIRMYYNLGSLVQMLFTTIESLVSFTTFLIGSVLFFSFSFNILDVNFANEDEYSGINTFVQITLQTFRNSIGDLQSPTYQNWTDKSLPSYQLYLIEIVIWSFWLGNIFLNLIILLNFLIAVISQVYD